MWSVLNWDCHHFRSCRHGVESRDEHLLPYQAAAHHLNNISVELILVPRQSIENTLHRRQSVRNHRKLFSILNRQWLSWTTINTSTYQEAWSDQRSPRCWYDTPALPAKLNELHIISLRPSRAWYWQRMLSWQEERSYQLNKSCNFHALEYFIFPELVICKDKKKVFAKPQHKEPTNCLFCFSFSSFIFISSYYLTLYFFANER